ncbi:MAG: KH domain-containing protein [Oscillospiraceae bacterium]|jgi:spoIIIJ-associated protein|nr:KH domain-containing protein [Oscillospiraceae bacterium]
MTNFIEHSGKTEAEAANNALAELNAIAAGRTYDYEVQVLEKPKKGVLGLGSVLAKVRLIYTLHDDSSDSPELTEDIPEAAPEPTPQVVAAAPDWLDYSTSGEEAESADDDGGAHNELEAAESAVRTFLIDLLKHMTISAELNIKRGNAKLNVKIIPQGGGDASGLLIGRRGETLDALQRVTSAVVNKSLEPHVRIYLDTEGYRERRNEMLTGVAERAAQKVVRSRRDVTLDPMNAYERHVIHTALQNYKGVHTFSLGREPNRRVVVGYGTKRSENRGGSNYDY